MTTPDISTIIQSVIDYIKSTGEVVVTEGFKIAVKRTLYLGVQETVHAVAILIVIIALIILIRWIIKSSTTDDWDSEAVYMVIMLVAFMILGLTFAFIGAVDNALDYFINPEWNAVKILLELVK